MTVSGAKAQINEALNRVLWEGEEVLVYKALREALKELDEVRIVEVVIE